MLIKNSGAALALLGIVGIAVVGFWVPNNEYQYTDRAKHHQSETSYYYLSPALKSVGGWADDNHEAVEALSAIGTLVFTFVLAIFTGVLAWRTTGLFRETKRLRKTANEQRADMLRSIEAGEKAASAAIKSANVAEQALSVLERPHVFIESIELIEHSISTFLVRCKVRNYGKTPGIIIWSETRRTQVASPGGSESTFNGLANFAGRLVVGNEEIKTVETGPTILAINQIDAFSRPVTILRTEITYTDIFSYVHVAEFSFHDSVGTFVAFGGTADNRKNSKKLDRGEVWEPSLSKKLLAEAST
jgi:hypothetical protein